MATMFTTREGRVPVPGGSVWYQVVGAADAVPPVAVAGGPGATHDYLEPLAALADERPVVFFDSLGSGKSDKPDDLSLWRNDRFVEELARVIEAVSGGRVHLLGHSYGTVLATIYALRHPTRLASLVLAGPCLSSQRYLAGLAILREAMLPTHRDALAQHIATGGVRSEEYQAAEAAFYARYFCRLNPWPEPLARTEGNPAAYRTMWGTSEFVANGIHKDEDLTGRLPEITVPTLFTCGRHDLTRPNETAADHARVPGSEIVVFEESGHMPHLEEPARYLAVLRDFVHRVDAG